MRPMSDKSFRRIMAWYERESSPGAMKRRVYQEYVNHCIAHGKPIEIKEAK